MNAIIERESAARNQATPDFKMLTGHLERGRLVDCVLHAANAVGNGEIHPVVAADRGATFQPRIMLALLSFCYARGIYCSQDVAAKLRAEAFYQILCHNDCPDGRLIRRFRRGNLPALHHCLENLYREVAARHPADRASLPFPTMSCCAASVAAATARCGWPGTSWTLIGRLVEELIRSLGTTQKFANGSAPSGGEAQGGAVPLNSRYYLLRDTDLEFTRALARRDSIILLKGARQMGKTSLLARGLHQARADGLRG